MIHEHRKGRETLLKNPQDGRAPGTRQFYMLGYCARSQLKVVSHVFKKFEKHLSRQSPHFTEGYTKAEKEKTIFLGSEAFAQSR